MKMKEKIKQFIKENLVVADIEIGDNDDIFDKGFVNSLFAMKLLDYIESEFNKTIDFDDMKITNFNTVNHIIAFIEK